MLVDRLRTIRQNLTPQFWKKIIRSPYYRRHPVAAGRAIYARYMLGRHSLDDRSEFLAALGIAPERARAGLERWWPLLEGVLAQKTSAGITRNDGLVLYGAVRALQPDYVIETGVAQGVSTSFLAAALIENGHGTLYSIELPPDALRACGVAEDGSRYVWAERGVAHLVPPQMVDAMGSRWRLLLGDVRQVLPSLLDTLPHVDVVFHDDLHTPQHQLWEYQLVWPRIAPWGVLLSDDATEAWGAFLRAQGLPGNRWTNFRRMTGIRKPPAQAEAGRRLAQVGQVVE